MFSGTVQILALITPTDTVAAKQGIILLEMSHSLFDPNLKRFKAMNSFTEQKVHKRCPYNPVPLILWNSFWAKNLSFGFGNLKEKEVFVLKFNYPVK